MIILVVFIVGLASFVLLGLWRIRVGPQRLSLMTWNELVAELKPVQTEGITELALEHLQPERPPREREHEEAWQLIGGAEGLTRMAENSDVFLALASYAQRWNPEQGVAVAARMRQDGLALRRAVVGLGLSRTLGYGRARMSLYVQEAASAYYLMRKRLLTLYKADHAVLYPILGEAL